MENQTEKQELVKCHICQHAKDNYCSDCGAAICANHTFYDGDRINAYCEKHVDDTDFVISNSPSGSYWFGPKRPATFLEKIIKFFTC